MDSLRSPIEVTTIFFVMSIAFYIFLFWRSQAAVREDARQLAKRRVSDRRIPTPMPAIRTLTSAEAETLILNQLFEEDTDTSATSH